MREGSDALIVSTGICLKLALEASDTLRAQGLGVSVLHCPTIKPLDVDAILDYANSVTAVVTLEEHTILGGLGSAVAELIAEANFDRAKKFKRIGLPDVFPEEYGSQDSLMGRYHITTESTIATVTQLLEL